MTQNNLIKFDQNEGLASFDNFIEEQFTKANFASLSVEEQQAHKKALVKAIMARICILPLKDDTPITDTIVVVETKKCIRTLSNGKYNYKPLDPDYFKKYWKANLATVKVECPRCGTLTGKCKIARHYTTGVCIKKTQARLLETSV